MSAQVAADLRAAAEVLERDGWTQEAYHEQRGSDICHCALGSLLVVSSGDRMAHPDDITMDQRIGRFDPAVQALMDSMDFTHGLNVVDWNDEPGRTAAEVIAALRAAALRAAADRAEQESDR